MSTTVLGLSADHLSHTRSTHAPPRRTFPATDALDPAFVFDFRSYDEPDAENQRWTTWYDVEPLCRGPEPRPDWVITDRAAVDTELGILKTGKEADVFLLERAVDGRSVGRDGRQALPRRRAPQLPPQRRLHRGPARSGQPRGPRRSRRAPTFGRAVAAGQWANAEWESLKRCWHVGLPVPYPVQIDGTELLMEWIRARRRDRSAAGADPARARAAAVATSSSCARRSPRWPSTGSCTATCRRTTCSPPATVS